MISCASVHCPFDNVIKGWIHVIPLGVCFIPFYICLYLMRIDVFHNGLFSWTNYCLFDVVCWYNWMYRCDLLSPLQHFFCFNFLRLYSLFHFLCIYFLTFTVFIFRHCLLSHFAISTYIFYVFFLLLFFLSSFIFFFFSYNKRCQMMPFPDFLD